MKLISPVDRVSAKEVVRSPVKQLNKHLGDLGSNIGSAIFFEISPFSKLLCHVAAAHGSIIAQYRIAKSI